MARSKTACLFALALAAGALDAIDYLGLGRVFTANMTGNTVLLAISLAKRSAPDAARSGIAPAGFCAGAADGVALVRSSRTWPARARRALLLETVALIALLVVWAAFGDHTTRHLLICLSGIAMGAQSAAVRASDLRGVNTTYMTSTLVSAIARMVQRARGTPPGPEGPNLPGAAWIVYGSEPSSAPSRWRAGTPLLWPCRRLWPVP